MIAVCATDGFLRVIVERRIPSSLGGQWDPARVGKLTQLIHDYIEAAEMADALAVRPHERFTAAQNKLCKDVSTRE